MAAHYRQDTGHSRRVLLAGTLLPVAALATTPGALTLPWPQATQQPWFYPVLAAGLSALVLGGVALACWQLNRRLRREMAGHEQAVNELQASAQRFRQMVDVMASPLLFVRLHDGQLLYGNRKARELFALEGGNPSGPVSVIAYYAHPQQRQQLIDDALAAGAVLDREILLRLPSGGERLVLLSAAVVDWQGEAALVSSFVDITERKRFENALHAANSSLNEQLLANQQLQQQLRQLASCDPLTGLYNRRHLEDVLPRELARARREQVPLSLVMLDIDHFKAINDRHGHLVGDQLLILFAAVLREDVRAGDVACRYGGEEFLLMLPTLDQATAAERAEGWRQRLQQTEVRIRGGVVSTTVSIGVACFPEHGSDWDSLVGAADAALYQAKDKGRNRIVMA